MSFVSLKKYKIDRNLYILRYVFVLTTLNNVLNIFYPVENCIIALFDPLRYNGSYIFIYLENLFNYKQYIWS